MTDPKEPLQGATDLPTSPELGAGALLRRAREASGMHVGALSVMLKVPVQRLDALESERWDLLPDPVFVRALAASVCRTLKVDPAPVLAKLPSPTVQSIEVGASLNAPFRGDNNSGVKAHGSSQFSRPLILAVMALLLGALVMALLPSIQQLLVRSQVGAEVSVASPSPPLPVGSEVAPVAGTSEISRPPQPLSNAAAPEGATQGALAIAQNPPPMPTATAPSPEKAEASEHPSKGVPSDSTIVFRAKGPSWIQVTDAGGAVVLKKEVGTGETATASGRLPLSVVVGRADVTSVEVRGKPMDLAALAKNNVARFEVKE